MKSRVPSLLLPLLLLPGALIQAAITAGWQVPIQAFGISPQESKWVHKLDKPPAASPFFQPGDELWDLSGVIKGSSLGYINAEPLGGEPTEPGEWPGEWVVWNARSGMIVARGETRDLRAMDLIVEGRQLPTVLRTKLELVSGADGKTASACLVSRSGERATLDSDHSKMAVEITEGEGMVDERLELSWSLGETTWTLNTAVTLWEGERLRIARHADASSSWELFATATVEYLHGVPVASSRWQESDGGLALWPRPAGGDPPEPIEGRLGVGINSVPPDWLERLGLDREKLPELEAPASVGKWSREPLLDVREALRQKGFKLAEPGAFVGFHLQRHRLITVMNREDRDLLEAFVDGGYGYIPTNLWIEACASGCLGLLNRSGERATLMSLRGEEKRVFEIEPTIGDSDLIVDLHYRCDVEMSPGKIQHLESQTILLRNEPQVIASQFLPGREEQKITLVARYTTQEEEEKEHR